MQTNFTIEWGHPDLLNGVLRSFLVTLEEIESFNSTACCEYFPVQEVSVQSEKMNYSLEVSFTKISSGLSVGRVFLVIHDCVLYWCFCPLVPAIQIHSH
jgi:hypothetical protein